MSLSDRLLFEAEVERQEGWVKRSKGAWMNTRKRPKGAEVILMGVLR